jgi:lipopolysaccharide biosynthesis protein
MQLKPKTPYLLYRCVTPMWDNTARRTRGATVVIDSTPALYENWLSETIHQFIAPAPEENFVFINAWNEWAEGNHLEPCQKWGRAYLEATKRALQVPSKPDVLLDP